MFLVDRPLTILLLLAVYIILLFILKNSNFKSRVYTKNCNNICPKCDESLERVRRNYRDHCINYFTFQIFNFKKFVCKYCSWIGLKTEKRILKKSV